MYEVESINNPCQIVIVVNPKEYFKQFENLGSNKKHKGIKKGTQDMDFQNYANRILFSTTTKIYLIVK